MPSSTFKYVETKGPTLEELPKVIDGDDAEVAQLDITQVEKEIEIDAVHNETAGAKNGQKAWTICPTPIKGCTNVDSE